jgi:hypothetical protein
MLLSTRMLKDAQNVNSFEYADVAEFFQGDPVTVYFQLIDASQDRGSQGFVPPGRRFVPAPGATLTCIVESIDIAKQIVRLASQPFAQDGSIWALQFFPTDIIKGTANLRLNLVQNGQATNGILVDAFRIRSTTCVDPVPTTTFPGF